MEKSTVVRAKINPKLKKEVEGVFQKLGISTSQAITLFFYEVKLTKKIPFEIHVPNKETLKVFQDSDNGKGLIRYKDVNDMFKKLGI